MPNRYISNNKYLLFLRDKGLPVQHDPAARQDSAGQLGRALRRAARNQRPSPDDRKLARTKLSRDHQLAESSGRFF